MPQRNNMPDPPTRFTLGHKRRMHGQRAFASVYAARCRKTLGPVTIHGRANGLTHPRLGLSVPKRVGNAVRRNRIKRLIREAFRLSQHDLPAGYDLVVSVRPHNFLDLTDYQRLLRSCAEAIDKQWRKRSKPTPTDAPPGPGDVKGR